MKSRQRGLSFWGIIFNVVLLIVLVLQEGALQGFEGELREQVVDRIRVRIGGAGQAYSQQQRQQVPAHS